MRTFINNVFSTAFLFTVDTFSLSKVSPITEILHHIKVSLVIVAIPLLSNYSVIVVLDFYTQSTSIKAHVSSVEGYL